MNNEKTEYDSDFNLPSLDSVPESTVERFSFLNPIGGEIYHTGSTVGIYWTGGPSTPQRVGLALVDLTDWVVMRSDLPGDFTNDRSPGFYQWTIPPDMKLNPTHRYLIYIQSADYPTWTYGSSFSIVGNPPY